MSPRFNIGQVGSSLKAAGQRFAFGLLIATAFAVMVIGKADTILVERARSLVVDIVTPMLNVLSKPVAAFNDVIADVHEISNLRSELRRLREENARLLTWQNVAQQLESENNALRSFLNFRYGPQASFVTARVVGDSGSAFVRSMLLNAGKEDGIKGGQAVMTADGLVGRIAEVGDNSARVLLLTDLNSRIPVILERSRERAILAGDNSRQPRLAFVPSDVRPEPGERVVTSGHGGTYPAGLPVGVVSGISDGIVRIQPLVEWNRLEFVRVVDFGIAGALPSLPSLPPPPRSTRGQSLPPGGPLGGHTP